MNWFWYWLVPSQIHGFERRLCIQTKVIMPSGNVLNVEKIL